MLMLLERIRLTWWNTGLTPPNGRSRGASNSYNSCFKVLDELTSVSELIGLCEIGDDDIAALEVYASLNNWKLLPLLKKTPSNRSYFDHAVLYNPQVLEVEHYEDIISVMGNTFLKAAQHIKLKTKSYANPEFNLFISHWPSKVLEQNEQRAFAAQVLRLAIQPLLKSGEKVVLMGDYNDSPHSNLMNVQLQSTKCYAAVISSLHSILYNPFWKLSTGEKGYTHLENNISSLSVGTNYYNGLSPEATKWQSFDQIIFSGNFLGGSEWHLDEPRTRIINIESIANLFSDKNSHVDHFPVTAHIVRP
ncbi:endonuclease/exonuclease/phosphatase family protein [Shewanella glacialipiscicola]|uniref:endonuclease/exonuclease/phosphatase family protein n=1 Tax=Shewanella glacialipiscicola TaxID=614069 RepID=UPI003D7B6322